MSLIRFFIVVLLLLLPAQALALFMPDGSQVNAVTAVVSNDVGC